MDNNNLKPEIILEKIWANLEKAVVDRKHEYHQLYFSNINKESMQGIKIPPIVPETVLPELIDG